MPTRRTSFKFPALEYIFNKITLNGTKGIGENHSFTLKDISEAYDALKIPSSARASISNTILDLTRKNRGIEARLPKSIIDYGYDLRKKTGRVSNLSRVNYAGEFVFVGVGNTLNSWFVWPEDFDKQVQVKNLVPEKVKSLLAKDEGALFSVIDYCDVLSLAIYDTPNTVIRVQNPMKWQPNEIDGLYFSDATGEKILFPVEAKALSTKDDINLEQMLGAYNSIITKAQYAGFQLIPLGIQMTLTGMKIAIFKKGESHLEVSQTILVIIDPSVSTWNGQEVLWYNKKRN